MTPAAEGQRGRAAALCTAQRFAGYLGVENGGAARIHSLNCPFVEGRILPQNNYPACTAGFEFWCWALIAVVKRSYLLAVFFGWKPLLCI